MADSPLPPPGMADALNVKPAVAIAAAAKPIAILRIMMLTSIRSEHPSLSESNSAVLIELQRAALSPGVQASESCIGIFNNNEAKTARERVLCILKGFRMGAAIPPIELVD